MKVKFGIIFTCSVVLLLLISNLILPASFGIGKAESIEEYQIYTSHPKVYFDQTGHWYQLFESGLFWNSAKNFCFERGAHLITIGSPEENALIHGINGDGDCHIGATDQAQEGVWQWVTGENLSTTYTNWREDEPNNIDNEDYCVMEYGEWNDVKDGGRSFVCEFTEYIMGKFVDISGEVLINDNLATIGDFIKPGDNVVVGEDGLAAFKMYMLGVVKDLNIGSNSFILVTDDTTEQDVTLEFFEGKLRGIVDELPEDYSFEVWTPQAVIGVRGTEWVIEGDENQSIVTVLDSSVEVSMRDDPDESVMVEMNQELQVTTEGLGEPYEIDPNDVDDWWTANDFLYYFSLILN
jgi:hypothetical protein